MQRDTADEGGPGCMHFFLKGFLENLVLSEASTKPTSGTAVMEVVRNSTDGMWSPSPGAMYPLLRRMEKAGLIKAELAREGRGRRSILYSATAAGKRKFEAGRKKMLAHSDRMMRIMTPLMMRVTYQGETKSFPKLYEYSKLIAENRAYIISLRPEKMGKEIDRMISVFRKIKEDRERGK